MRTVRLDSQGLEELPASVADKPDIAHLSVYNNALARVGKNGLPGAMPGIDVLHAIRNDPSLTATR